MGCALKIRRSGKTFCVWLFRRGPGAGVCLRPSCSLGTCALAVDGGVRHSAYCSELWKLQETKRRSDLGLGVCGLHKGGMSLELPGVSSSLGSRGEVSRRGTWGSPWPPGTTPGLFSVAGSGQEQEAPWSFGGPSPRGGSVGQGQAGVMVGPAWITCLDPPTLGLCRCVRRAGELPWPGLCPAHRPAHLLLLPDQRRGRQHLELALLPAPHHHRILLHAQPGAGRALGVRGHALVCHLCVCSPRRGLMGLDMARVVGEARLGLAPGRSLPAS